MLLALFVMKDAHTFVLPTITTASALKAVAALGASYLALLTSRDAYESYRTVQQCLRTRALDMALSETQSDKQEKELGADAAIKTLFVHGLGLGGAQQMQYYLKSEIFNNNDVCIEPDQCNPAFFDFQDAGYVAPSYLGQSADIKKLKEEYDKIVASGHKVRLYGLSRGAATIINFLALYKPKNIVCAVIESPFDDLETIIEHKLNLVGVGHIPFVGPATCACITQLATVLPLPKQIDLRNHSVFDIYPKDVVHEIPHTIPLLFISSSQDWVIPQSSTQHLVDLLQMHGHKHCYHEQCAVGGHADIVTQNDAIHGKIKSFLKDPYTSIHS